MSEETSSESSNTFVYVGITLVLLPILYVLSIGPVVFILLKMKTTMGPLEIFYAPVIWLHDHTFLTEPLENYVRWWGGL